MEWHHTTTDDMVELERIREGSSRIGVGELGLPPARVATTSRIGSRRGTVRPGTGVEELSRGRSKHRELGFDVSAPPLDARALSQVERGRPVATSEYILHVGTVPNSDTALFRTRG